MSNVGNTVPLTPTGVPVELPAGSTLQGGRYVVRRTLGRGGFGITYEARDHRLQRAVALKELFCEGAFRQGGRVVGPPQQAEAFAAAKRRFLREASVLARFTHPGIVRVYEVFEEAGTAYLVMELLEGRTLFDVVTQRGRPMSEREALGITLRCADALEVVHAAGILHRDLNPANVMLVGPDPQLRPSEGHGASGTDRPAQPGNAENRVVLIDFGLAREYVGEDSAPMTRMVTPGYAPPEQYGVETRSGPPADVYGLAATLYWALTMKQPRAAIDRQTGAGLPSPRSLAPEVSKLVSDAVLDGLELNPAHRPQTVVAFVHRLGLEPLTVAPPPPETGNALQAPTQAPGTQTLPPPPAMLPVPPAVAAGRRKALVPLFVLALACSALAPVATAALLTVAVLPAMATAGDAMVYVRLRRAGTRLAWRHRATVPALLPVRFLRNLGRVFVRVLPALLLLGAAIAIALLVDGPARTEAPKEWILRIGALASTTLAIMAVVRDRLTFRVALVLDHLVPYATTEDGKLTPLGQGVWVVALVFAVGALALRPDLLPF